MNFSGPTKTLRLALLILLMTSAFLIVFDVDHQSIWLDEASTLNICQSRDFLDQIKDDKHPPLYYFLCRTLTNPDSGNRLSAVRLLSASFSVILLLLVYLRLFSERDQKCKIVFFCLFSFSPALLWVSQEARMYSLNILIGTALFLLLEQEIVFGHFSRKNFAAIITLLVTGIYTHYYFFLFAMVIAVHYLIARKYVRAAATAAIPLILYLPWLQYLISDAIEGISWNPVYSLRLIPVTFFKFTLGEQGKSFFLDSPFLVKAITIYLFGFCFVAGTLSLFEKGRKLVTFYLGSLVAVILVSSILSISFIKNAFLPKYFFIFLPFYFHILSEGIVFMRKKAGISCFILIMVAFSVANLTYFSDDELRGDWISIRNFVKSDQNINTIYYYPAYMDLPFKYMSGLEGYRSESLDSMDRIKSPQENCIYILDLKIDDTLFKDRKMTVFKSAKILL